MIKVKIKMQFPVPTEFNMIDKVGDVFGKLAKKYLTKIRVIFLSFPSAYEEY